LHSQTDIINIITIYSLLLGSLKNQASLVDPLVELAVVVQVSLDLIDREINKHGSDLGGISVGGDSLDVLIDIL
jgi:hypothetical protein